MLSPFSLAVMASFNVLKAFSGVSPLPPDCDSLTYQILFSLVNTSLFSFSVKVIFSPLLTDTISASGRPILDMLNVWFVSSLADTLAIDKININKHKKINFLTFIFSHQHL